MLPCKKRADTKACWTLQSICTTDRGTYDGLKNRFRQRNLYWNQRDELELERAWRRGAAGERRAGRGDRCLAGGGLLYRVQEPFTFTLSFLWQHATTCQSLRRVHSYGIFSRLKEHYNGVTVPNFWKLSEDTTSPSRVFRYVTRRACILFIQLLP